MIHWNGGDKPLPEVEIRMDVSFAEVLCEALERMESNIVINRMQRDLRTEIERVCDLSSQEEGPEALGEHR